jgi:beta-fructofuranosidase
MKRKDFILSSGFIPFVAKELTRSTIEKNKIRGMAGKVNRQSVQKDFFYKPENAWAADFIPLYAEGAFQLFYLHDWRDAEKHGEGTPWYRLTTTDFVNFTEHGEVLPRGGKLDQDLYVFTGSAIKANGRYHIFYTGHNHHLMDNGAPAQAVMHATSDDLQHWTKIPGHTFFAPSGQYEKNDWRDAFVFFNHETNEYNMLLAARLTKGMSRRRGLTACCTSKDLVKWEVKEPFYAPNQFFTHECPDLFKMGGWWYLVFSEFTDLVATRYRMSRSLKGPWLIPDQDTFDGHAFYAAKTASDGKNRYIFGWNPTKSDDKDSGRWNWGGNLVVHQIVQQPNGTLTVRVPATVINAFNKPVKQSFSTETGEAAGSGTQVDIKAPQKFQAVVAEKMPASCMISTVAVFSKGTKDFGCMIRCSDDLDKCYYIRLEPAKNRLAFDMWPREVSELNNMVELERQVELAPAIPVLIQIFIDGNKGVAYINNSVAMNFRAYDLPEGKWGFFATDGNVRFKDIKLATI